MHPTRRALYAVGIGIVAITHITPICAQEPVLRNVPLLARAMKVAIAADWVRPFYLWKDTHTVIAVQGERRDDSGRLVRFLKVETRTGTARPFASLNAAWRHLFHPTNRDSRRLIEACISPDGRWIAWMTGAAPKGVVSETFPDDPMVVSLESTRKLKTWNWTFGTPCLWTADSSKCIGFDVETGASVLDMTTGQIQRLDAARCIPSSSLFSHRYVLGLGMRTDGRVLVANVSNGEVTPQSPHDAVKLIDFGLDERAAPPRMITVGFPEQVGAQGLRVEAIALSPDGRRLVWQFYRFAFPIGSPDAHAEFWISQADGTQMRFVGWLDQHTDKNSYSFPAGLQWSPDGERLSFVYNDALYTVPANQGTD